MKFFANEKNARGPTLVVVNYRFPPFEGKGRQIDELTSRTVSRRESDGMNALVDQHLLEQRAKEEEHL